MKLLVCANCSLRKVRKRSKVIRISITKCNYSENGIARLGILIAIIYKSLKCMIRGHHLKGIGMVAFLFVWHNFAVFLCPTS